MFIPASRPGRLAMTLLEAMVATAIFASILAVVFEALGAGTRTANLVNVTDSASNQNSRVLRDVVNLLRYADVNRIYLDGTAWTTQVSGSDYYSFKVCTGFQVTSGASAPSLDRVQQYGQGIVLRFSPNGDGTGSLYETIFNLDPATAIPISTAQSERLLVPNLAWRYVPAGTGTPVPGFQVVQLDPTQASVVGNQVEVRLAALIGTDPSGGNIYRDVRSAVYLRSSMYDGLGLLTPVVTSTDVATANQASPFIYDIIATNDPTRYSASGLPAFLTCDPYSGRISGTPTATGSWSILVTATNSAGSGSRTVDLTVKGPLPQIISSLVINTTPSEAVLYQIVATNAPSGFGVTSLPANLVLDSVSGMISGQVPATGNWTTTMTATNVNGSVSAPLTINCTSAPLPAPVVTSASAIASLGQPFSCQIVASNSPTGYAATGLPPGLSLNSMTGGISGTPTSLGTYPVAVSASNASGTGTGTLSVLVQQPACVITSPTSATASVGASFNYQITATNSPTSYEVAGEPAWLTCNASTGQLAGVPTGVGIYTLTVSATNAVGTGYAEVSLTVDQPEAPGIGLVDPISATAGVLFSYTPSVTPAVPTTWSVAGLPAGVNLGNASTGAITGIPAAAGTYYVTFSATNAGGSSSADTTIVVAPNPALPVVTLGQNTGNGANFQVLGSIAAATGMTLDKSTFEVDSNQSLTLYRGWVASEASAAKTALSANEFLLTGKSLAGAVSITARVSDTAGNAGSSTRSY